MRTHKPSPYALKTLLTLSLALTAPLTACDDGEDEPVAGAEAGTEGGHHAGHEGGHDAGHEGGHDAGHEGGHDAGHEGGHEAGVMAGTEAGVMAGTEAGTEAGVMAGTEAGVMAGTEAGVMAGTEAGMSMATGALNELDEAGRRAHCQGQVEALFALLPTDDAERAAYITQSCTMSGLFAANEAACTQELASCTEGFETVDVESAVTECMTDALFNTCAAPVDEIAACQIAQTTFYANMIQELDLTALSCADAGDYFGPLGTLLTQLMPAPADLCTPAANACLTEQ